MAELGTAQQDWTADLSLLEDLRWARKEFLDRLCRASRSQEKQVLSTLRLEATYQVAEFFFLLRAHRIDTEHDLQRVAELHNQYIVDLTRDPAKMERLGLNPDRVLEAMFTADTMPRLLQNWREQPGAIDQSNLARLLMSIVSAETCRKVVVACAEAGFLSRTKTPYGTVLVRSHGSLEEIFGGIIGELRQRIRASKC